MNEIGIQAEMLRSQALNGFVPKFWPEYSNLKISPKISINHLQIKLEMIISERFSHSRRFLSSKKQLRAFPFNFTFSDGIQYFSRYNNEITMLGPFLIRGPPALQWGSHSITSRRQAAWRVGWMRGTNLEIAHPVFFNKS